jgi:Zn-dependent protease
MDRERIVSSDFDYRGYDPIHPRGTDWRGRLRKLGGPLVAGIVALAKFSFVLLKFASVFIAVAAYALIWGWPFAVGFVLLILLHETGHYIEAKREGLDPKLPVFIPFLLAYVRYTRGNPWQTARVALAGPILGGVASFVCYLIGKQQHSGLLLALAYAGFLLNLINLLPFGMLDGGAAWRSARFLRLGGGRSKAMVVYALFFATAVGLAVGALAAHVPQHRL